ncbi:hypothetical protein AGMMS49525_18390 [Bacteroidia bacterium]|nr:hypothetical protein AGMMS49525_18390 [Bacteroidia bacterium]
MARLAKDMGYVHWAAMTLTPWDDADCKAGLPRFWETLRERTAALQAEGRAVIVGIGCNLFEWGTFLRRIDNFLMDLAAEPLQVERFLNALTELHMAKLEKVCAAVGDCADFLKFGDDLGMDTGPFMSPETYRRFFKPHHKRMCDYVRKHSGMKLFLHSCGSIYALLPDLIDAGFEVINPVQTSCHQMEPERLKREFGRDVTFWGGGACTREISLGTRLHRKVGEHLAPLQCAI